MLGRSAVSGWIRGDFAIPNAIYIVRFRHLESTDARSVSWLTLGVTGPCDMLGQDEWRTMYLGMYAHVTARREPKCKYVCFAELVFSVFNHDFDLLECLPRKSGAVFSGNVVMHLVDFRHCSCAVNKLPHLHIAHEQQ